MNRVFFPQDALDEWIVAGLIDLSSGELTIMAESRRYKVTEAVRILAEVTGTPDPLKIIGKVKLKSDMEKVGAELLETSMIIGDNAYDVVPGFVGTPIGTFLEHVKSPERKAARIDLPGFTPKSEEELLAVVLGSAT